MYVSQHSYTISCVGGRVPPYMMTVGCVLLSVLVALAPVSLGPVLTRLPSSAPRDESAGDQCSMVYFSLVLKFIYQEGRCVTMKVEMTPSE